MLLPCWRGEGKSQGQFPLAILTFTTDICPKPRNPESSHQGICPHVTHPADTQKHTLLVAGLPSLCQSALHLNTASQLPCSGDQDQGWLRLGLTDQEGSVNMVFSGPVGPTFWEVEVWL